MYSTNEAVATLLLEVARLYLATVTYHRLYIYRRVDKLTNLVGCGNLNC